MPVTYKIDSARKLIRTRCIGDVNLEQVIEHFRELQRDPNLPDRLDVLLDLTEITSVPNPQEIRVVSHEIEKTLRSVQFQACAIVVWNDVLFGMMRMFEVFAGIYFTATRVFRVTAEAESWLASHESNSDTGK